MARHAGHGGGRLAGGVGAPATTQGRLLVFLASNLLWIAWGLYAQAYALILLQVCLAAMNLRGTHRNEAPQDSA